MVKNCVGSTVNTTVEILYRFLGTDTVPFPSQGPTITKTQYKPGRASSTWNLLALLQPLLAFPHNQNDSNNSTQFIT